MTSPVAGKVDEWSRAHFGVYGRYGSSRHNNLAFPQFFSCLYPKKSHNPFHQPQLLIFWQISGLSSKTFNAIFFLSLIFYPRSSWLLLLCILYTFFTELVIHPHFQREKKNCFQHIWNLEFDPAITKVKSSKGVLFRGSRIAPGPWTVCFQSGSLHS